jgi:hypothetical protein
LVDPAYSSDLGHRDLVDLREMRAECAAVETAVSYTRRLAQGRFEILSAEQARRQSGGTVHDLVADLPRILGEERGRSSAADARLVEPEEPEIDIDWGTHGALIADESLATLDDIADDDLATMLGALADFERELSDYRQALHRVLDGIDQELGARAVDGVG